MAHEKLLCQGAALQRNYYNLTNLCLQMGANTEPHKFVQLIQVNKADRQAGRSTAHQPPNLQQYINTCDLQ